MPLAQTPADPSQWSSPLQAPVDSGACCSSAHLAETPTCCLAVSSGPGQLHVVRAWHLTPAVSGVGSSQAALQASQFFLSHVQFDVAQMFHAQVAMLIFCLHKNTGTLVLKKMPQAEVWKQHFPVKQNCFKQTASSRSSETAVPLKQTAPSRGLQTALLFQNHCPQAEVWKQHLPFKQNCLKQIWKKHFSWKKTAPSRSLETALFCKQIVPNRSLKTAFLLKKTAPSRGLETTFFLQNHCPKHRFGNSISLSNKTVLNRALEKTLLLEKTAPSTGLEIALSFQKHCPKQKFGNSTSFAKTLPQAELWKQHFPFKQNCSKQIFVKSISLGKKLPQAEVWKHTFLQKKCSKQRFGNSTSFSNPLPQAEVWKQYFPFKQNCLKQFWKKHLSWKKTFSNRGLETTLLWVQEKSMFLLFVLESIQQHWFGLHQVSCTLIQVFRFLGGNYFCVV